MQISRGPWQFIIWKTDLHFHTSKLTRKKCFLLLVNCSDVSLAIRNFFHSLATCVFVTVYSTEQILSTRIKPETFVGEEHNPWSKWRNHVIMIHPLMYGSVVLVGDSACASGGDVTEAPMLTSPTVTYLYLHTHVFCALIKITADIYKLLWNIWKVNLQIRYRAILKEI